MLCSGLGAHAANALPDIEADTRARRRGAARAGSDRRGSRMLAAAALGTATLVLAVAPPGPPGAAGWVAVGGPRVLLTLGLGRRWRSDSRLPFVLVALVAVLDVVLLVARADAWVHPG